MILLMKKNFVVRGGCQNHTECSFMVLKHKML